MKTIFLEFVKLKDGVHDKDGIPKRKESDFLEIYQRLSFLMDKTQRKLIYSLNLSFMSG